MDFSTCESAVRSVSHHQSANSCESHLSYLSDLQAALKKSHDTSQSPQDTSASPLLQLMTDFFEQEETLLTEDQGGCPWQIQAVVMTILSHHVTLLVTQPTLLASAMALAHTHLEHNEPRFRALVATFLGKLTAVLGFSVYTDFQSQLLESIRVNLTVRDLDEEQPTGQEPSSSRDSFTSDKSHALDDTSGWKALETSIGALKEIMLGCGPDFLTAGYLTEEIITLVIGQSVTHLNRHVRAGGFDSIAVICELATEEFLIATPTLMGAIVTALTTGLADNWSQVRFAASVACRHFLMTLQSPVEREKHFHILIPRMCLNRYYMAEGVKLYSQDTWKRVLGNHGKEMVATFAPQVVAYYIRVSDEDNHVVREAACHCIAELGTKVSPEAIRPHVTELLKALLMCFLDDSWPVRDAACVASGLFVTGFPKECESKLDEFYTLWIAHLSDNVWSVREDAAVALGNVVRAYGAPAMAKVEALLLEYLPKASTQTPQTQAAYEAELASEKAHVGNQVYSCGSLAPKLRKGGCSDCQFHRPKELWEFSDGALYLVRELASLNPEATLATFPMLAEMAMLRHFPQVASLQETLWKILPSICVALGKKVFKRHLEVFFDPLVFTIQGQHRLASHAATECVRMLSAAIGPAIFKGRLEANTMWQDVLSPYMTPSSQPRQ